MVRQNIATASFLPLLLVLLVQCLVVSTKAYSKTYRGHNLRLQERFDFDSSSSSVVDEDEDRGSNEKPSDYKSDGKGLPKKPNYLTLCYNETGNSLYPVRGKDAVCKSGKVATGKYSNGVNETGWGILEVETFDEFEPEIQAYAAGVLEGILTKLQIYYHYRNTVEDMCKDHYDYCKRLYRYLSKNLDWIRGQVLSKPKTDVYWRQVNLTFTQLTGIFHGYSKLEYKPATNYYVTSILLLQLSGELFDLSKFFKRDSGVLDDPDPGKCSGFVKIADDNKDLFMAHVAMSGYNTMNRVIKLYKFAYDPKTVPGNAYSFSGYAGVLASADDYTLTSAGLLSIETTISVFNKKLYTSDYIKPENQLHCWVRSIIANQIAKTAAEWVEIFAKYNSGTYNNQWTVVDYKLFEPGKELPSKNVVWILEQVPGYTDSRDMTWFLKKYKYWPSYNIPYLTSISELSGFNKEGEKNNWYKWGYCPRARIFHRDQHKVQDLESLKNLMRYNDYTHDEYSRCACKPPYTAEASISTRGDLNPPNGTYEIPGMGHRNHGSLDYKGTNYTLFKKLQFQAIGGPTYGGPTLPAFSWDTTNIVAKHYGQPTLWKFQPFITEWETPVEVNMNLKVDNDESSEN